MLYSAAQIAAAMGQSKSTALGFLKQSAVPHVTRGNRRYYARDDIARALPWLAEILDRAEPKEGQDSAACPRCRPKASASGTKNDSS